jgi:23S rRNA-/tRNA-specific pseudouridylate synthase
MMPRNLEGRILLEAGTLLVIDKPPGLPSTGRSLDDDDCLQHAVIQRAGGMVWAVHQLDADTSGVNVFTTERRHVAALKEAMSAPSARKHYLAMVHGRPTWETQIVTDPIGMVDGTSLGVTTKGRSAHTEIEVLDRGPEHSLLRVRILTGRTHQIRIHAAHLGHPIIGEEWYRSPPCTLHPRQALHASRLTLKDHPRLDVAAPIPDDLKRLASAIGLRLDRAEPR